jgi:hypothetical protein
MAGNGARSGGRNQSPGFAGRFGRELPVQAGEQMGQLAADGPDAAQVRQRRAALY